jgi:hypothetical protein
MLPVVVLVQVLQWGLNPSLKWLCCLLPGLSF